MVFVRAHVFRKQQYPNHTKRTDEVVSFRQKKLHYIYLRYTQFYSQNKRKAKQNQNKNKNKAKQKHSSKDNLLWFTKENDLYYGVATIRRMVSNIFSDESMSFWPFFPHTLYFCTWSEHHEMFETRNCIISKRRREESLPFFSITHSYTNNVL